MWNVEDTSVHMHTTLLVGSRKRNEELTVDITGKRRSSQRNRALLWGRPCFRGTGLLLPFVRLLQLAYAVVELATHKLHTKQTSIINPCGRRGTHLLLLPGEKHFAWKVVSLFCRGFYYLSGHLHNHQSMYLDNVCRCVRVCFLSRHILFSWEKLLEYAICVLKRHAWRLCDYRSLSPHFLHNGILHLNAILICILGSECYPLFLRRWKWGCWCLSENIFLYLITRLVFFYLPTSCRRK